MESHKEEGEISTVCQKLRPLLLWGLCVKFNPKLPGSHVKKRTVMCYLLCTEWWEEKIIKRDDLVFIFNWIPKKNFTWELTLHFRKLSFQLASENSSLSLQIEKEVHYHCQSGKYKKRIWHLQSRELGSTAKPFHLNFLICKMSKSIWKFSEVSSSSDISQSCDEIIKGSFKLPAMTTANPFVLSLAESLLLMYWLKSRTLTGYTTSTLSSTLFFFFCVGLDIAVFS